MYEHRRRESGRYLSTSCRCGASSLLFFLSLSSYLLSAFVSFLLLFSGLSLLSFPCGVYALVFGFGASSLFAVLNGSPAMQRSEGEEEVGGRRGASSFSFFFPFLALFYLFCSFDLVIIVVIFHFAWKRFQVFIPVLPLSLQKKKRTHTWNNRVKCRGGAEGRRGEGME